jgi:hypothetical protein
VSEHVPAKYKIEIHFNKNRTTAGPNTAAVTVFESGARLNGEGDELVYICNQRDKGLALGVQDGKKYDRNVIRGYHGCGGVIPGAQIRGGVALCVKCESAMSSEELTSTLLVHLTTKRLAALVTDIFRKLDSNADIYVKYHPTDIRSQALNDAGGLDKGRMQRGLTIYPLNNIIRDTAAGSAVERRFEALFSA